MFNPYTKEMQQMEFSDRLINKYFPLPFKKIKAFFFLCPFSEDHNSCIFLSFWNVASCITIELCLSLICWYLCFIWQFIRYSKLKHWWMKSTLLHFNSEIVWHIYVFIIKRIPVFSIKKNMAGHHVVHLNSNILTKIPKYDYYQLEGDWCIQNDQNLFNHIFIHGIILFSNYIDILMNINFLVVSKILAH